MPTYTNFQLKRLKLKLDIVEKPENWVHKLTDSNNNGALNNPLLQYVWPLTWPLSAQYWKAWLENDSECLHFHMN